MYRCLSSRLLIQCIQHFVIFCIKSLTQSCAQHLLTVPCIQSRTRACVSLIRSDTRCISYHFLYKYFNSTIVPSSWSLTWPTIRWVFSFIRTALVLETGANMPVYGFEFASGSIFIREYRQTKWAVRMGACEFQILLLGNSIYRGYDRILFCSEGSVASSKS
jgi:hypothetical protein